MSSRCWKTCRSIAATAATAPPPRRCGGAGVKGLPIRVPIAATIALVAGITQAGLGFLGPAADLALLSIGVAGGQGDRGGDRDADGQSLHARSLTSAVRQAL